MVCASPRPSPSAERRRRRVSWRSRGAVASEFESLVTMISANVARLNFHTSSTHTPCNRHLSGRRTQKSHTKTLNIDLICSDRAPNGLVRSRRIAGGADQAAARVDKAFPMILTTRKTTQDSRRRSIASCEDRSARAVLRVRSGRPVPETWVATLAASLRPPGAERCVHRG